MTEHEDDAAPVKSSHQLPAKIASGVAATTAGLVVTGVAGPLAGAFTSAALAPVFDRIVAFDRQAAENAVRTSERAAELASMQPAELAAWSEGSPERLALLAAVIEAAWRLTGQQKAEALARILAHGVEDDARLDVEPLYVAAIREMEPAHIQTLVTMTTVLNTRDVFEGQDVGASGEWATDHLMEELPRLAEGMHYIVATLDRVGCIGPGSSRLGVGSWWIVTPFGHQCLAYLTDGAGPGEPAT
ncbi:hypothetical protein [Phycicoccus sp. Root101]|uniref:hypothetical protein n=1 Tax=Phycicoccus sp. Root101 TaxID=1736421 RepID=UPI00070395CA|nr:hypothetical protein [Phycicoccus sp. Root101]KQU67580.1 hypothetical protein ASC58_13660 [Phycicoccus sp. Root101]